MSFIFFFFLHFHLHSVASFLIFFFSLQSFCFSIDYISFAYAQFRRSRSVAHRTFFLIWCYCSIILRIVSIQSFDFFELFIDLGSSFSSFSFNCALYPSAIRIKSTIYQKQISNINSQMNRGQITKPTIPLKWIKNNTI